MNGRHAERLHAEYYLRVLQSISGDYGGGGDRVLLALARYDRDAGQILLGHGRMMQSAAKFHRLLDAYADAGKEVLRLRAPSQAVAWARAGLDGARERSDRPAELRFLNQLGNALRMVDAYPEAIECGEAARRLAATLGDTDADAEACGYLAVTYGQLGRFAEARPLFETALAGARRRGSRRWEAYWLDRLGSTCARLGEHDAALRLHEKALSIAREIGDPSGEASALSNLSDVHRTLGRLEEAEANLRSALNLAERLGDRRAQWIRLDRLAAVIALRGDVSGALELRHRASAIAVHAGDRRGEAVELHNLGRLYRDLQRLSEARDALLRAAAIFDELRLEHLSSVSRRVLASLPASHSGPPLSHPRCAHSVE